MHRNCHPLTKATAMRLAANLPSEMWPEVWQAAVYLYNRTPNARLGWKSPHEKLLTWLRENGRTPSDLHDTPDHSNLYAYGCRAYPLTDEALKRSERNDTKNRTRAYLGYLVGYEGRNIYRIWVPGRGEVRRTRDVTFKEDEFFDPDAEDLAIKQRIAYSAPAPDGYNLPEATTDEESEEEHEEEHPHEGDEDSIHLGTGAEYTIRGFITRSSVSGSKNSSYLNVTSLVSLTSPLPGTQIL